MSTPLITPEVQKIRGVNVPKIPNQQDILERMRRLAPSMVVFSPHPDWVQLHVHGRTDLWAPPNLGGVDVEHPTQRVYSTSGQDLGPLVVKADGKLRVSGRYLSQKDSSGKVIEGQNVEAIVAFIVHPDNYGKMGLIWLTGEAEIDQPAIAESHRIHQLYQRDGDEAIVAARLAFKKNWEKNPARRGKKVPPPTRVEVAAMDRLDAAGGDQPKLYAYECDVRDCPGYGSDEWAKFEAHMQTRHGMTVSQAVYEKSGSAAAGLKVSSEPVDPEDDVEDDEEGGVDLEKTRAQRRKR